jgi:hypothetical protein
MIESLFDRKLFSKNGHLTKRSLLDRKFIWPQAFYEKWSLKGHLNESPLNRMLFFEKWSLDRKSFWQKVKQHWFIIRIGKTFLIFETAFNQNSVWLPRCLRRRQAPCPRWKYKIQLNFPIKYNLLLYSLHDWNNNNDNRGTIFFLPRRLAATKKLGTCTIIMEYEQSVKWQFFENDNFSKKKKFGQMTFWSNDHFSKKTFGQMNFRSFVISVKWSFSEKAFGQKDFRQMNFRSNDLVCSQTVKRCSVK